VSKTGFGHEHGVIGQIKQGRINLDAANNAGTLVFDMASFVADTPEARRFVGLEGTTDTSTQQQVNTNMRGTDVLDVGRHPTATFTIKQVVKLPEPSGPGMAQYKLAGDLALHGVSRPIQVVAEVEEKNGWTHLRGGFTMLQSQFGITPFTKAFGAIGVADQLSVWGDIWIAKQRPVAAVPTSQR
jgi:polyisoprenoid-binding protein YceI